MSDELSNQQISILFFASIKQRAGVQKIVLSITEGLSIRELKKILIRQYPALESSFPSALFAINKEFAFDDDLIPAGSEVAIFPPVSGGRITRESNEDEMPTICIITEDEINLNLLLNEITDQRTGAAAIFTGMVRAVTSRDYSHKTQYLEYEAYPEMAIEKMQQVAREIRNRWAEIIGIAIVQRIGILSAGTPTVLIACTVSHRDNGAFEAARYGIDRLKEIVPIWKKEITPEGNVWIDGDYYPKPGD
jgi:molybdopterin synthase catalytic subunit